MTKTAFDRSNILTPDERAAAARKCLRLLADADFDEMTENDRAFISDQRRMAGTIAYAPTERVLAWLRDCVEKYAL